MVSLNLPATHDLSSTLRRIGLRTVLAARWGDERAYQLLLSSPGALALLDCPQRLPDGELAAHVRVLAAFAPVAVVVPAGASARALLDAGAVDVLVRGAPEAEVAARIRADLRWLRRCLPDGPARAAAPEVQVRRPTGFRGSQAVLLRVLVRASLTGRAVCCHDLRLLLGGPGSPLSPPALRGRLERLAALCSAMGHTLVRERLGSGYENVRVDIAS
jgi:hypothetical protein